MDERPDVVVVGAGHAGLLASFLLCQLGIPHVVLEANRIGDSWRSDGWTAAGHGIRLIPHGWNTAVGLAADLQLASALDGTGLVEYRPGSPSGIFCVPTPRTDLLGDSTMVIGRSNQPSSTEHESATIMAGYHGLLG